MSPLPWWEEGIRFECQGSGKCCVSRGHTGYVYLTLEDRRRFAKYFGIPTASFTRRYCQTTDGHIHLKDTAGPCQFLEGTRCGVYEARPTQCRTWPFWPENMSPRAWDRNVATFCPGVGKGKRWSAEQIRAELVQDGED